MSARRCRAWLLPILLVLPMASLAQQVHVPAWRDLSSEQKSDLSQFAHRWDRMPEERRALILERHARWQEFSRLKRQTLREGARNYGRMSPEQRERMRSSINAVRSLPEAQQRRLHRLWRSLTPRQRLDWLQRGGPGIAPPP